MEINISGFGFASARNWVLQNQKRLIPAQFCLSFPNLESRYIEKLFSDIDEMKAKHSMDPATRPRLSEELATEVSEFERFLLDHPKLVEKIKGQEKSGVDQIQPRAREVRKREVERTVFRAFFFPYKNLDGKKKPKSSRKVSGNEKPLGKERRLMVFIFLNFFVSGKVGVKRKGSTGTVGPANIEEGQDSEC